ncbi:mitochondrial DEAD-like helicase (DEXDc) domain-containing protein [Andalucia godoyi]|uniref:Mitochondrial DEAD-like helicase (DEXDc) domain-containing protein n=1 Tax=Andalucia godoyi TaxID=505711 RepID=A0A8K0AIU3_ANDGO|nr:mitochondrial DEAD-like helicase (DEXDc) domain-containing protein [Andalucia godoyi]|eukprot:ANDGO_08229.mRNA.1 mitochondrial DEAD-like helicase (DEXDc) domain-containing protein
MFCRARLAFCGQNQQLVNRVVRRLQSSASSPKYFVITSKGTVGHSKVRGEKGSRVEPVPPLAEVYASFLSPQAALDVSRLFQKYSLFVRCLPGDSAIHLDYGVCRFLGLSPSSTSRMDPADDSDALWLGFINGFASLGAEKVSRFFRFASPGAKSLPSSFRNVGWINRTTRIMNVISVQAHSLVELYLYSNLVLCKPFDCSFVFLSPEEASRPPLSVLYDFCDFIPYLTFDSISKLEAEGIYELIEKKAFPAVHDMPRMGRRTRDCVKELGVESPSLLLQRMEDVGCFGFEDLIIHMLSRKASHIGRFLSELYDKCLTMIKLVDVVDRVNQAAMVDSQYVSFLNYLEKRCVSPSGVVLKVPSLGCDVKHLTNSERAYWYQRFIRFGLCGWDVSDQPNVVSYKWTADQEHVFTSVINCLNSTACQRFVVSGRDGTGKREVMDRMIAAVVLSGQQVVVLSATSIRCREHVLRLNERFRKSIPGIRIGHLSRLAHSEDQEQTKADLQSGELNLLISTPLLFRDPQHSFENLGLLILDEEQGMSLDPKVYGVPDLKVGVRSVSFTSHRLSGESLSLVQRFCTYFELNELSCPSAESIHAYSKNVLSMLRRECGEPFLTMLFPEVMPGDYEDSPQDTHGPQHNEPLQTSPMRIHSHSEHVDLVLMDRSDDNIRKIVLSEPTVRVVVPCSRVLASATSRYKRIFADHTSFRIVSPGSLTMDKNERDFADFARGWARLAITPSFPSWVGATPKCRLILIDSGESLSPITFSQIIESVESSRLQAFRETFDLFGPLGSSEPLPANMTLIRDVLSSWKRIHEGPEGEKYYPISPFNVIRSLLMKPQIVFLTSFQDAKQVTAMRTYASLLDANMYGRHHGDVEATVVAHFLGTEYFRQYQAGSAVFLALLPEMIREVLLKLSSSPETVSSLLAKCRWRLLEVWNSAGQKMPGIGLKTENRKMGFHGPESDVSDSNAALRYSAALLHDLESSISESAMIEQKLSFERIRKKGLSSPFSILSTLFEQFNVVPTRPFTDFVTSVLPDAWMALRNSGRGEESTDDSKNQTTHEVPTVDVNARICMSALAGPAIVEFAPSSFSCRLSPVYVPNPLIRLGLYNKVFEKERCADLAVLHEVSRLLHAEFGPLDESACVLLNFALLGALAEAVGLQRVVIGNDYVLYKPNFVRESLSSDLYDDVSLRRPGGDMKPGDSFAESEYGKDDTKKSLKTKRNHSSLFVTVSEKSEMFHAFDNSISRTLPMSGTEVAHPVPQSIHLDVLVKSLRQVLEVKDDNSCLSDSVDFSFASSVAPNDPFEIGQPIDQGPTVRLETFPPLIGGEDAEAAMLKATHATLRENALRNGSRTISAYFDYASGGFRERVSFSDAGTAVQHVFSILVKVGELANVPVAQYSLWTPESRNV